MLANPESVKASNEKYNARTRTAQAEKTRLWRINNPEKERARSQRQIAKHLPRPHKYGIGIPEYKAMMTEQNGLCGICGRGPTGKRYNLDIDHDHVTGAVRGLLCQTCNRMLSNAHDDTRLLSLAIAYLCRTKEKPFQS